MKPTKYIFPNGTFYAFNPIAALILCNAALITEGKNTYWGSFIDENGNNYCYSQPAEKPNVAPDASAYYSK